jgi:aryl-alcohol dehydrogenase-like predicted oxidoreductase
MKLRQLGPYEVTAIGFGCMNLSHGYGPPQPRDQAERVIRRALELGVTHFDTAALYGFGANEQLIGSILGSRPDNVIVASKCGCSDATANA